MYLSCHPVSDTELSFNSILIMLAYVFKEAFHYKNTVSPVASIPKGMAVPRCPRGQDCYSQ